MAARTQRATKGKKNETGGRGISKALISLPAKTAATRLAGGRPSRTKALLTASLAGGAGGAVVYKLLRSGGDD